MNEYIRWYLASESMFCGDYVISDEDPNVRKCNMKDEVPIGKLTTKHYTNEYIAGDRVPVKSIWFDGKLIEFLQIGDHEFVPGKSYEYIKMMVEGKSYYEYLNIVKLKTQLNDIISKLKYIRDEL